MVLWHSWLPLTWHKWRRLGELSGESLIPPRVYTFQVCCFLFGFLSLLGLIRLKETFYYYFCPISSCFICLPLISPSTPLAPHSPPAPSRCVNQYSLLTHDSPHMSSTASGLHWGAGIVYMCMCVCSHEWVQLWCVFSLFFCVCVHTCVCMCVNAWKSTRLAGAFSKGLLLSAQINLLSPWVNTLIHLCIWLHVVCVSACVCKHANPGEGLA